MQYEDEDEDRDEDRIEYKTEDDAEEDNGGADQLTCGCRWGRRRGNYGRGLAWG